jgi:predicted dehydrogenase
MDSLPTTSRIKDRNLGGGALLDLGIYPLTMSNLILDGQVGEEALRSEISSSMTVVDGVDHSVAIVVNYPSTQCLGILTASLESTTRRDFCRIEGSRGVIILSGPMAAKPTSIRIQRYNNTADEIREFEHPGSGFYFEANAVALCVLAGKLESDVMPLAETRRIAAIMDKARKSGGVLYPQD